MQIIPKLIDLNIFFYGKHSMKHELFLFAFFVQYL